MEVEKNRFRSNNISLIAIGIRNETIREQARHQQRLIPDDFVKISRLFNSQ